jgi:hypothetical protein
MQKFFLGLFTFVLSMTLSYAQEFDTHLEDDLKFHCNRHRAYSTGVSDARKGLARKTNYAQICNVDPEIINAAYEQGYIYGLANIVGPVINEPAPHHPDIEAQLPASQVQPFTRPVGGVNGYLGPVRPAAVNPTAAPNVESTISSNVHDPDYPGLQPVPTHSYTRPHPVHGLESLHEIYPSGQPKCIEGYHGQACGFNCVNSLGNVRCAATPDQYCKSDIHGHIACGYHCIAERDDVRCAIVPTDTCVSDHNGRIFCGVNCQLTASGEAACQLVRYAP